MLSSPNQQHFIPNSIRAFITGDKFVLRYTTNIPGMKKTITLAALGLSAFGANAQITLNQSSYSSWLPGGDSVQLVTGNLPVPGANMTIDLSSAAYGNAYAYNWPAMTNPAFPAATYGRSFIDVVLSSTNNGLWWSSTQLRGNTATGINVYGEQVERQAIALITAPTDSFVTPAQTVTYSAPRSIVQFPATYQSTWSNSYQYSVNSTITIAAYNLNNVPFSRVSYVTTKDSVAGWGKMRIKKVAGNNSAYMDVLAIKTKISSKDSLMMGGTPAPPSMLGAFGFTQGAINEGYYISWYRAGEVTPLLQVSYTDNTYSTVKQAEVQQKRIPAATSVRNITAGSGFTLYPNPAAPGSNVHIDLGETPSGLWDYELLNTAGQIINAGPLTISGKKADLPLNSTLPAGNYYITIRNNGRSSTLPLFIRH